MVLMTVPSAVAMFTPIAGYVSPMSVLQDNYVYRSDPMVLLLVAPFFCPWLLLIFQIRMLVASRVTAWECWVLLLTALGSFAASDYLLGAIWLENNQFDVEQIVIMLGGCVVSLAGTFWTVFLTIRRRLAMASLAGLIGAYCTNAYMVGVGFFPMMQFGWWFMVIGAGLLVAELLIYHLRPMTNESASGITHSR